MTATILTLFNEFPFLFFVRVSISLILLATLIMLAVILYKHSLIDKIQRNSFIVLSAYVVGMLYFTVFGRYSQSYYRYESDVFASYRQLFENFDSFAFFQIVVNLTMLIPVGFLLCLIIKSRFKYQWAVILSVLLTLGVEALQFVSRCGTFEVDDLINNTISAVLGIIIYVILKSLYKRGRFYELYRRFI